MDADKLSNLGKFLSRGHLLGHLARMREWITEETLREALEEQLRGGGKQLGGILVERGHLTAGQLSEILKQQKFLQETIHDQEGPSEIARRIGHYGLTETLGVGGSGVVWKAWDMKLKRWVALKEPRLEKNVSRERFLQEAQAAARLRHPNLVEVFEVGREKDVDYIVMDFVDGKQLDKCRREPKELAAMMAEVCDAVHYMHSCGVLHRDIKPQNVLVDLQGKAHLGDFGLAKVEGGRSLTEEGTFMGTPQYMSPEQASGRRSDIGPRTDVYGLGATLYHGLTGQAPYEAESDVRAVFEKLMFEEPPSPRSHAPEVSAEMEMIVRKAMAKWPQDRYVSAAELAEDLRRFVRGEPVRARRMPWLSRVARWVGRNRKLSAAVLAAAIGLGAGVYFWTAQARLTRKEAAYENARDRGDELWKKVVEHARLGMADRDRLHTLAREALSYFENASSAFPERTYPWLMKGRCQMILGRGEEAAKAWSRALETDQEYAPALFERGKFYLGTYARLRLPPGPSVGEHGLRFGLPDTESPKEKLWREKGEVDLARARRSKEMDPSALDYLEGTLALGRQDYARAAESLGRYTAVNAWDAGALSLQGTAEYHAWKFEAAEKTWSRAIRLEPRAHRHQARGDVRFCLKKFEKALADYDEALRMDPVNPFYLCNRGLAKHALKMPVEAVEDYTKAIRLKPDFARAYNNRGTAKAEALDLNGAEKDFRRATVESPFYVEAYNNRGNVLVMQGKIDEALEDYDMALEIDPDHPDALGNRGLARIASKKFDGAVEDFSHLLAQKPKNEAEILYQRARAYRGKGDKSRAVNDFRESLRKAPDGWPRTIQIKKQIRELESDGE